MIHLKTGVIALIGDEIEHNIIKDFAHKIDLFIKLDDEPSDQNHGITLNQARENYKQFGKCWKYL